MTDRTIATVLCVAAEQLTLAMRGLVLQSEGYEVISASTFEDAMRLAATRDPDLIICEQTIGKESGARLADCLKQLHPETPILLITGVMESIPQSLAVDAIMTKIDGPETFLRNVAALLESPGRRPHAA
ncbi:MAG: response regulator [Terriglobales bacterium]|jgi:two-component system response regulator GlrR